MNKNYLLPASDQVGRTSEGASHHGALHFPKCDAPGGLLRPYPAYKDSGVPWLGKIPAHWKMRRLDTLFTLRKEPPLDTDQRITGYLDGRVTLRSNVQGQKIKGVIKEAGWQRVYPGDLAISGMNAHLGGMGVSDSLGKCSPIYLVLRPNPETNAYFVSHAVRHIAHIGMLKSLVNTIRFNSADFKRDDLKLIRVWIPPEDEQRAIAAFLDAHDRLTRRYIHAQQRLIKLLTEQKQALIQQAVTRGLDPDVPLKDSGIAWLGKIPAHWEIVRVKHLLREVDEKSTTGEETLLSLRMNHGLVPHDEHFTRPGQASTLVGYKLVRPGQVVLNRLQANNGLVFASEVFGVVSPDYAVFNPIADIDLQYLTALFRTPMMKYKFRIEAKGLGTGTSGFFRLYTDCFGAIPIPIPPRDEQSQIMHELDVRLQGLQNTIERTERQIALVREYRARLIADVVTGKLDVRGFEVGHTSEGASHLEDAAWEDLDDEETGDAIDDLDVDADGE